MLYTCLDRLSLPDMEQKPVVGSSACLLGHPVRYDGDHRREKAVADVLAEHVILRPFCPETGIGLPVPRPPIQVVRLASGRRVREVADRERDYTDALNGYARQIPDTVDAFILKARSPSCGLGTTPLLDERDRRIGTTSGEFARALAGRFPLLPIEDESTLIDRNAVEALALKAYLYRAWRAGSRRTELASWLAAVVDSPLENRVAPWLVRLVEAGR